MNLLQVKDGYERLYTRKDLYCTKNRGYSNPFACAFKNVALKLFKMIGTYNMTDERV